MNYFNYSRRQANEVYVGATPMGGAYPIRIQSMTNTVTMDTEACVEQAKRIIEAGGEYVRLTTQGVREAENLQHINASLRAQGYQTPLVADVHFNPKVAEVAALYAEKVRINPGNYVDAARTFKQLERFAVRPHHVALRRYSRGHGRIVHGVPAHLCGTEFHERGHLYQGFQYGYHGTHRPPVGRTDGKRKHGLPAPLRSDRSR